MNKVYGRLTVISVEPGGRVGVRCSCGTEKTVRRVHLLSGKTRSCGCIRSEALRERRKTHAMSCSREYRIWRKMKERCYSPSDIGFQHYGGKGIRVCDRWRHSFENFIADMGICPPRFSIERDDVDGDYEPSNCRWATRIEQANNMTTNVNIEHEGEVKTIAEWARELGLKYATLYRRLVVKGECPASAFRGVGE